jgi:hypothetical protein
MRIGVALLWIGISVPNIGICQDASVPPSSSSGACFTVSRGQDEAGTMLIDQCCGRTWKFVRAPIRNQKDQLYYAWMPVDKLSNSFFYSSGEAAAAQNFASGLKKLKTLLISMRVT